MRAGSFPRTANRQSSLFARVIWPMPIALFPLCLFVLCQVNPFMVIRRNPQASMTFSASTG